MDKWKIGWGITSSCNMQCPFCYSYSVRTENESLKIPSTHIYERFVKNNAKYIDSINWGVGENSISSEWYKLISAIRETSESIVQAVTTNGYLGYKVLRDKACYSVFKECIDDIDISLDFSDKEKHNFFRGNSSAFDWAMKTIELCAEIGKPRTIVMIGCNETFKIDNVMGLFEIAKRFECNLRINILRPVKAVSIKPLNYDSLKSILVHIIQNNYVISLADPLIASLFGKSYPDPTGITSMRILPDGSITPSTYLVTDQWRTINILEESVDINDFSEKNAFKILRSKHIPKSCNNCKHFLDCKGGVKDRRIIWYNSLEFQDPYCPGRHDNDFNWLKDSTIIQRKPYGPLVHEGYLPTLIFMPS